MASLFSKSLNFVKVAWATQPVLVISTLMGVLGPLIVIASPLSEKTIQSVNEIPRRYPYPITDHISKEEVPDS